MLITQIFSSYYCLRQSAVTYLIMKVQKSCKNNKYFVVLLSNIRTNVNIVMRGGCDVRRTETEHLNV